MKISSLVPKVGLLPCSPRQDFFVLIHLILSPSITDLELIQLDHVMHHFKGNFMYKIFDLLTFSRLGACFRNIVQKCILRVDNAPNTGKGVGWAGLGFYRFVIDFNSSNKNFCTNTDVILDSSFLDGRSQINHYKFKIIRPRVFC